MRAGRLLRWVEGGLWAAGLVALGYCGFVVLRARIYQADAGRQMERAQAAHSGALAASAHPMIGRVAIPRVGLSAMVLEGSDERTLSLGVGHLTGTALPGRPGNVVLTAHRDTFFRPLRDIRRNDSITLTTLSGPHQYRVESTSVVRPDSIEVLQASAKPTLTLLTCYPFQYLGPAPERFVVRAREVAPEPPVHTALPKRRPARPVPVESSDPIPEPEAAEDDPAPDQPAVEPAPPRAKPRGLRRFPPVRVFAILGKAFRPGI